MHLIAYLVLHLSHLLSKSLKNSGAAFVSALNFTFWAFDPADRSSEVDSHRYMLLVGDERNRVADIFFEADLFIVGILIEGSLIFAG